MPEIEGQKILATIEEASKLLSIGRSKLLEITYDGTLPSLRIGRRRLYSVEGLQAWARDQMVKALTGTKD